MSRIGVLSMVLLASALATPSTASSQTSGASGPNAVVPRRGGAPSAAARLAPSASLPLLFPPAGLQEQAAKASPQLFAAFPQHSVRNRKGIPFMVAGGVLFVAGAIAGNTGGAILMLGGAGVGAYGAYIYFGGQHRLSSYTPLPR